MSKVIMTLAAAAVLVAATTASAALKLVTETVEVTAAVSGATTGTIDIYLDVDAGGPYPVDAVTIPLFINGPAGFSITGGDAHPDNPFVTPNSSFVSLGSGLPDVYGTVVEDDVNTLAHSISGLIGVYRFDFEVDPGVIGTWNLSYGNVSGFEAKVSNSLPTGDPDSGDQPFTEITGSVTVNPVPEPASVLLAAAGGVLMLSRRPKRQRGT
jgi:hypothetical protein